jgi:hypothetical protein
VALNLRRSSLVFPVLAASAVVMAACGSSAPSKSSARPIPTTGLPTTGAPTTTTQAIAPPAIPDDTTAGPLGPLSGGAAAVPAPTGQTVTVPSTIVSNCSQDVSGPLKHWLNKLPANSTVVVGPQACYRVDKGLRLRDPHGLTIYGGTFTSDATAPGPQKHAEGVPVFTLAGGSNVSFESMKIDGQNPGGYHPKLAFAGGIEAQGTDGLTIKGVTITKTFGDGITLDPLRGGSDHKSGTILGPTMNVVVDGATITGVGRQGVTFASVSGAQISNLVVEDAALTTFDFEADQGNEGSVNVVIDGCTSSGGGLFFANGGGGSASYTHDLTVAHCAMAKPTKGYAVLSINHGKSRKKQRGPIYFVADTIYCGASASVACVELSGAKVTVEDSVLHFPRGTLHEAAYHLVKRSTGTFSNDLIEGYGKRGHVSKNSAVQVTGGHWVAATGGT